MADFRPTQVIVVFLAQARLLPNMKKKVFLTCLELWTLGQVCSLNYKTEYFASLDYQKSRALLNPVSSRFYHTWRHVTVLTCCLSMCHGPTCHPFHYSSSPLCSLGHRPLHRLRAQRRRFAPLSPRRRRLRSLPPCLVLNDVVPHPSALVLCLIAPFCAPPSPSSPTTAGCARLRDMAAT